MSSEAEKAKAIVEKLHAATVRVSQLNDQVSKLTAQNAALQAQVDGIPKAIADATATATGQIAQRDATIATLHDQLADYVQASAVLDAELRDVTPEVTASTPAAASIAS